MDTTSQTVVFRYETVDLNGPYTEFSSTKKLLCSGTHWSVLGTLKSSVISVSICVTASYEVAAVR